MTVEQHETFVKRDIHHGSVLALFWLYCIQDLHADSSSADLYKESVSGEAKSSGVRLGVPVLDRISEAVRKGDEDTFRQLISLFKLYEAADLNQLDSCGSHPLHWAVVFRRDRMLRTMLHYKNALRLNVDITDAEGVTALEIAIKNRNHKALKKLAKHGCSTCTAASFEKLRQMLLRKDDHPLEVQRGSLSASCRSEIGLPTHDQITTAHARSKRHLWHPITGTHWSSEICEKAVQQCYVNLTKYMEPSLIVPLLVQSKHLRLEQVNEIFSLQTKREQALMLLSLLPRSGRYAYQGLFKALKDETELKAHEELLEQLERTCESLLNTEGENAGLNQEMLDDVTTFYPGEDHRTPTPAQRVERSLELSDRAESGIYTATPSGISITHSSRRLNSTTSSALLGTQSSGRLSMPSHRTGSSSRSRTSKKRSSTEKPSVVVGDTINHRASTDFRAPDECPARSPLKFFDAVVKREPAPVKPVFATESNAGSDACLVDDHPRPIQETTSTGVNRDVDLSDSFSQLILSASGGYEGYDVEKDTTSEVCKLPSPKPSAPIDIPSRTDSFCTLPSVDSGDGAVEEMRVPPQQLLSKQISTDTTSTDSDSSDNNYIPLDVAPTRRWWTKAFNGLLDRCKMLASIPDSTENRSDCEVGRGDPKYVVGCGMRM